MRQKVVSLISLFVFLLILISCTINHQTVDTKIDFSTMIFDEESLLTLEKNFDICNVIKFIWSNNGFSDPALERTELDCNQVIETFFSAIFDVYCKGHISSSGIKLTPSILTNCDGLILDNIRLSAIVNRFDLTPTDMKNCGEYRLIYTINFKNSFNDWRKMSIIFEPVLPNPIFSLDNVIEENILGCLPAFRFWENLNKLNLASRSDELYEFFFEGLSFNDDSNNAYEFLLSGKNLSTPGQIRTSIYYKSNDNKFSWQYNEFKFIYDALEPTVVHNVIHEKLYNNSPYIDSENKDCFIINQPMVFLESEIIGDGSNYISQLYDYEASYKNSKFENVDKIELVNNINVNINRCLSPYYDSQKFLDDNYFIEITTPEIKKGINEWISNNLSSFPGYDDNKFFYNRLKAKSCIGCHLSPDNVDANNPELEISPHLKWPRINNIRASFVSFNEDFSVLHVSEFLRDVFLPHRKKLLSDCISDLKICLEIFKDIEVGVFAEDFDIKKLNMDLINIQNEILEVFKKGEDVDPLDVKNLSSLTTKYSLLEKSKPGFFYLARPTH